MITTSQMVAIALLICAIGDSIAALYIMPAWLRRHSEVPPQQARLIQAAVNMGALLCFATALGVYLLKPFD